MSFEKLQIIEPIIKALKNEGYTHPTPIQEQSIPLILQRKDILGCARTGTGKTAAFAIPIIQILHQEKHLLKKQHSINALVLTPTRELAIQVRNSFETYGKFAGLRLLTVFGGVSQQMQVNELRKGVDILVATPGRLLDLMQQQLVHLSDIRLLVLDEADRMLDMGFVRDVRKIIAQVPARRQTLFFSATMAPEIGKLAASLLKDPVKVEITPVSSAAPAIHQSLFYVEKKNKLPLLMHLLNSRKIQSALVFTRTKHGADKVAKALNRSGVRSEAIHGNKSQTGRQRALQQFTSGQIKVLVATDIAARGIDIEALSHVFNFDLPNVAETYVHRIGRTGRAGASGIAFSFCDPEEKSYLKDIEKLITNSIPVMNDHPYPVDTSVNADQVGARATEVTGHTRPRRIVHAERKNYNRSGR